METRARETPARPFSPTPRKRQPSLGHQHPWRQELGTSVAEALTKQKAPWLTDQQPPFSFYPSGRRQRIENPKVHPPPKGIPRHWEGGQEGLAQMSGRSSPTYPPYPPTHTKRKVYRSPRGSQEDWRPRTCPLRLVSPLQVWTAPPSPPGSKKQPLPDLAGSVKHQMPSPGTQVGIESKDTTASPKASFASKDPSRV